MRATVRIFTLLTALAGSLLLLFQDVSEPVTREARWALLTEPAHAARCEAPARGAARWQVDTPDAFPVLAQTVTERLGQTCADHCRSAVNVRLAPTWIDKPNFFTGFGRIAVEVTLDRRVGTCHDTFTLHLDMSVEEGRRGSPAVTQAHTGLMAGAFFRELYTADKPWPRFKR